MKSQYQKLGENKAIKRENISFSQIRKVLGKARRTLESAKILLASGYTENTYEMVYEAMLSAGRALVFSHGFRPRAQGSHKIVIEFCEKVLGNESEMIVKKFDRMRKKRHYLIYGAGLAISRTEAGAAIQTAGKFIHEVEKIINKKDSQKKLF